MAAIERLRKFAPWFAAVALVVAFLVTWKTGLIGRLSDYDRLIADMRSSGWRGPLICVAIQFAQVIIFFIPGEITQIASGYVFGAWRGFVFSTVGILLGSGVAFLLGRVIGRPTFEKIFGAETLHKLRHSAQSPKGRWAIFLLFLTPGAPKDAMSYGAGLSGWPLGRFVLISGMGRLPALLASTVFGGQLQERNYTAMAATAAVALAAGVGFYLYQRKARWVEE
ncbi:MAG: VTT domain-containing protein [Bryobacterales bacterium]